MPTVLLVAPGAETEIRIAAGCVLEVVGDAAGGHDRAASRVYDLLVLSGMDVDEQAAFTTTVQLDRRWRLVPVLYVLSPVERGFQVPGTFRADLDALIRGELENDAVHRRIGELARDGTAEAGMVAAGRYQLDPRGKLRFTDEEVALTEREAEILSILIAHADRTVSAAEIIERGWGAEADDRYLQILRRHVSNIRRKLERTTGESALRTVRGAGYRFEAQAGEEYSPLATRSA